MFTTCPEGIFKKRHPIYHNIYFQQKSYSMVSVSMDFFLCALVIVPIFELKAEMTVLMSKPHVFIAKAEKKKKIYNIKVLFYFPVTL